MKKFIAMLMAALLVVGCFAACQPSSEGGETQAQQRTVVVGYTIYEPMNYTDESGKLIGFDTELAEAVFAKLGYKVMFQLIDWGSKYTDLDSGTIDCVWNGFTCNTADDDGILRSEKVDFSYNYMENRQVVVVKKNSETAATADLTGKLGAAEAGSAGEAYAKGFEGADIKGFPYQTDCLLEVNSGSRDFAVVDAQLAKSYCGKGDYADLTIVSGMSSDEEFYAIGFKKGSDLTAEVNKALIELNDQGVLEQLARKYGLENAVITNFSNQ